MFRFEVKWYDSIDSKMVIEKGIIAGEGYGAAADRLVKYYDRDAIVYINLYELDTILTDEDIKGLDE